MRSSGRLTAALVVATGLVALGSVPALASPRSEASPLPVAAGGGADHPARAGDVRPGGAAAARRDLADHGQASRTQVVVGFARTTSAARRSALARSVSARSTRHVSALGVDVLQVADARRAVALLRGRREVRYAEPVVYARRTALGTARAAGTTVLSASPYDPAPAPERGELDLATPAPAGADGTGQTVAVIDDGVNASNTDLVGRVDDGGNFSGDAVAGGVFTSPQAGSPHGTAVAAVIAAAQNGTGIQGVAPRARVRSYRVFPVGAEGASSLAIASAINAVASRARTDASLHVANLSLGSQLDSTVIRNAVAAARTQAPGLLLVAAAGNDYSLRPSYPAGYPGVLSVGASGDADKDGVWEQADFSDKGDVDVLAPGVQVHTWWPGNQDCGTTTATPVVCELDGTSFASPEVAGIAAQLAAAGKAGTVARTAIKAAAQAAHVSADQPAVGDGSGRAAARRALALAGGIAPYATVFLDRGAVLGATVDHRAYEAVRIDPTRATSSAPVVTAPAGYVITGATSTPTAGTGVRSGTVTSAIFPASAYSAPLYTGQDPRPGTLGVTATGAAGDTVPVLSVPGMAGDAGQPTVDRYRYTMRAFDLNNDTGYGYDAYTRSAYLRRGATYVVSVTYPADPSPLFITMPTVDGGTSSVQSADYLELGTDVCPTSAALVPGRHYCTLTAPVTGTYAFGLFNTLDGLSYDVAVDRSTPLAAAPALVSDVLGAPAVPVSWNGSRTPGERFDVDYLVRNQSVPGGVTWSRWITGTTATRGTLTAQYGSSYYFRVRAVSAAGRASAWSPPVHSVVPYDEHSYYASYSTGWTTSSGLGHWGPAVAYSGRAGATVKLSTNGYRFTLVGDRCTTCGQVKVYVDSRYVTTVDTRASATQLRKTLWRSAVLAGGSAGRHTVIYSVVGTAGRPTVRFDALGSER